MLHHNVARRPRRLWVNDGPPKTSPAPQGPGPLIPNITGMQASGLNLEHWPLSARSGPEQPQQDAHVELLDDLVSAREERWRNRYAERLSGVQIDHQFELRRLLDGQIRGPATHIWMLSPRSITRLPRRSYGPIRKFTRAASKDAVSATW